jgi:hypothetical protein
MFARGAAPFKWPGPEPRGGAILPGMNDEATDEERPEPEPSPERLHPAEHRGYRELYVGCRQLVNRWGRLVSALERTEAAEVLKSSAGRVSDLLTALGPETEAYGVYGGVAAQGFGARIADFRSAFTDRSVDTGMVMRLAVLDIEHVTTLLGQLASLADARGDARLATFCRRWQSEMRPEVKAVRKAAISLGSDPDRAAAPLDASLLGRAAHGVGWVAGSVGEAVDKVTGSLRPRD